METVVQELKYAIRSLTKRPEFAVMVVVTLALGIGANTAIFSILHALVLQSLPVADPERLVVVSRNQLSLPYPLFRHFEDHSTTLEGLMAFRTTPLRYTAGTRPSASPEHWSLEATSRYSACSPSSAPR